MSFLRITALVLCLASLAAAAVCIFTDWNDGVYLPLALCLRAVGNALHILSARRRKTGKEAKR